jgi:hypothetical protein
MSPNATNNNSRIRVPLGCRRLSVDIPEGLRARLKTLALQRQLAGQKPFEIRVLVAQALEQLLAKERP